MIGLVVGVLAVGLFLALPNCAAGQAAPQPLPLNIISAVELTDPQKAQMKAFADFWTAKFACATEPGDVEHARDELIRPVAGMNQISPSFRYEYSAFVVPPLQELISKGCAGNLHVVPNALLVLEKLGADKAANVLLQHADVQGQQVWQIRLSAARGCHGILKDSPLDSRKILDAARKLRDAAGRETEPRILGWQLSALNVADSPQMPKEERDKLLATVRDLQLDTVNAVAKRLAAANNNPHPSGLIDPLNQAVVDLRTKFLGNQLTPVEQADLAKKLGWTLGQMLEFVSKNFAVAQGDPNLKKLNALVVGTCEGFLPTLDIKARGEGKAPATQLKKAWETGDKAAFEADVKKWLDVLGQAPYVKP